MTKLPSDIFMIPAVLAMFVFEMDRMAELHPLELVDVVLRDNEPTLLPTDCQRWVEILQV